MSFSGGEEYSGEFGTLYDELRAIARKQLKAEGRGHILQPTALVNEAYLRLSQSKTIAVNDRTHFLSVAARSMRQVLVDHARSHGRSKRGGSWHRVTLAAEQLIRKPDISVEDLDDALTELESLNARQAAIVDMRFFGGMQNHEIAAALGISAKTVQRDWAMARAWLSLQLRGAGEPQ